MNITFMIGNLVREPERIKDMNLVKLVIAVDDNFTKADGTRPVEYFNVSVWNKLADICEKYLSKGSKIAVCGKTQNRKYTTADGVERYVTEIVATDIEFLSIQKKQEQLQEIPLDDLPF